MPAGRPTAYKPEYAKQAEKLCRLGATSRELADFFEVSTVTIWNWSCRHEEFFKALEVGTEVANKRIRTALYHKAVGYSYDAVKIFCKDGEVTEVPYREHVPPDTTAIKFWLVNKDRDENGKSRWLDKVSNEVSGPDGGPIETVGPNLEKLSDEEVQRLRDLVAKTTQPD